MRTALYLLVTLTVTIALVSSFLIFRPEAGYLSNLFRAESKNIQKEVKTEEPRMPIEAVASSKKIDQGDVGTKAKKQEVENTTPYLYIAIISLSIATFVSVLISFYLYRWRRIVLRNAQFPVPEQFNGWLRAHDKKVMDMADALNACSNFVIQRGNEADKGINKIGEMFLTLQKALDEKDAELRKYKKGYDAEIYKRFLNRFIRTHQALEDVLENAAQSKDDFLQIKKLLEDALEECGVEAFSPEIGGSFRLESGVADNPKTVATSDASLEHKIASVISRGYKLKAGSGEEVITPAKVAIYKIPEGDK